MESRPSEIVRSLAGHDAGMYYMVLGVEGDKLYLVNGKNKKRANPKIKKQKHVQILRGQSEDILSRMKEGKLNDADVIHRLRVGKEIENV